MSYSSLDLYGKPYGVNYVARYSLCKCIGSTFAQYVVCAVDISTDLASIFGTVQVVSSPNPFSTKAVLFLIIRFVVRKRVKINKACFAGIALFSHLHPYSD